MARSAIMRGREQQAEREDQLEQERERQRERELASEDEPVKKIRGKKERPSLLSSAERGRREMASLRMRLRNGSDLSVE